MKNYLINIINFILMAVFLACGTSGTANNTNPNISLNIDAVTLGQIDLENYSRSQIEIPFELFGTNLEDLNGASFDIQKTDVLPIENLDPQDFFVEDVGRVVFFLYNIEDGDTVSFTLHLNNGSIIIFEGIFSESSDSFATLQAGDDATTLSRSHNPKQILLLEPVFYK